MFARLTTTTVSSFIFQFVRINKTFAFISSWFPFSAQEQSDQVIYNPNEPQTVNKPELRKTIIAWLCVEYLCVVNVPFIKLVNQIPYFIEDIIID